MGPIIIFDKSSLESLNPQESFWLDNFYLSNITPLFFIETLGDIEKKIRRDRTPEEVVGNIAYKTPDSKSSCNVHHLSLLGAELVEGREIDMRLGRPIIAGGEIVELEGKMGTTIRISPEEEAFQRWQKKEFLDIERQIAKKWRQELSSIDPERSYRYFQRFFPMGKPKTFAGIKRIVNFYIDSEDQESVLLFGLSLLGISKEYGKKIVTRWKQLGTLPIREFAPYFTHVFSVDLAYYLADAADLIPRRRTNKVDIAYLYYIPFCMVFTSNDEVHIKIAPLFMRKNQTFVLGTDLKKDLEALNDRYSALPNEVKDRGAITFAAFPPLDKVYLTSKLWDKHMSPAWRIQASKPTTIPSIVEGERILKKIERFKEEGTVLPKEKLVGTDRLDHMIIERKVRATKAGWKRYPPEVINRIKNEKGEWEDVTPA